MLEKLGKSLVHELLWTGHVESFIELDFAKQVVDVFGVVVVICGVPFAEAAKVVVHNLFA